MTGELFTAIIASGTVGAVCGVVIKHVMDTRLINEIKSVYEDYISKLKESHAKREGELISEIKKYQELTAKYQAERNTRVINLRDAQPKSLVDCMKTFYDVTLLPEGDNWLDVDFPNSNEEGKL